MNATKSKHSYSYLSGNPAVYVGTYAKYNNGNLFGAWVDLSTFEDAEEFNAYCKELHKDEQDPELMYQDYENFPRDLYDESSISNELWEYINIVQTSTLPKEAIDEYIEICGTNESIEEIENKYFGKWDSELDFANDHLDNWGLLDKVDETIKLYFDYDAFARDLFIDDYFMTKSGYVFYNH